MAQRTYQRPHLKPEQIVLLALARSELGPDHQLRVQSATQQEVDWGALWQSARAHGVGYFVGRHLLARAPSPLAPLPRRGERDVVLAPSFLQRVKEDLYRETARALALSEHQLRLNAEFERSQVPVLWLKGLVLAQQLYGRIEARHCGDLDILVESAHLARAERILAGLGFEPYHPALSGEEFHPLAAHHTLWSLRLKDDWLLLVELHHRLSGPRPCQPPVEGLFQRSRVVDLQGQAMRIPSLEDELLILCLHAHHHNYSLLRCLMDVAEYVKHCGRQIDWLKLVREARTCHCLGRLRAALEITDAVLGLEAAEDIFAQVPALTSRQGWARRRLPFAALLDPSSQDDDRRQVQLALLMDRWSDTCRLLAARLLPAKEHVRAICPRSLASYPALPRMYYFLHAAKRAVSSFSSHTTG